MNGIFWKPDVQISDRLALDWKIVDPDHFVHIEIVDTKYRHSEDYVIQGKKKIEIVREFMIFLSTCNWYRKQ